MNLSGYNFTDLRQINATEDIDRAAVYVVMTRDHSNADWCYLYVGQTGDVARRFNAHEKWNCWLNNRKDGGLWISLLLEPNRDKRLFIETYLISILSELPCNRQ